VDPPTPAVTATGAAAPEPGDIGITTIHGDAGRLISLGQYLLGDGFQPWEHCFVYLGDGELLEAEPGGARIASLTEYDDRPVLWLRCPAQHRDSVTAAARHLKDTPYSALEYFALAAHRFHLPIPGLRDYIDATGHAICSRLADKAAQLGGWQIFDDHRWSGYVVPADLARLALAQDR